MITVVAVAATTLPAAVAAEPDQAWIVVLSDEGHEVPSVAAILTNAFGGELGYVYEHALEGFSVTMTPTEADALAASPLVAWVEPVVQITFAQQTTPAGVTRIGGTNNPDVPIGSGAAIDVDVAVIDTGVDFEHPDLNVVGGVDCAGVGSFAECVPGGDDDHYHGTHVAGTIAALDNGIGSVGVAPGARVWAVKVLMSDGVGSTAGVIAGIDWVTANADVIEVANMSLAGPGYSHAEYLAVQRAVDAGVAFVAAAGNDATDASYFSPASFGNVLTVSALADYDGLPGGYAGGTCRADPDDTLAEFSNWGSAVDIAAPGTCIRSTVPLEYGVYGTLSGTSMAAPHVAAGVALLAAADPPTNAAEVQALYDIVVESGNIGWTDTSGDGYFEPLLHVARFSPLSGLLPLYESEPGSGDVNCDAEMSIVDALIVAQHAAGLRGDANGCDFGNALVELHADAGDINDDTRVDIVDALLIARCVAGLDAC
ncbi:MAG: S8 family serine peptidase [Actinomycetota bacterium]